MGCRLRVVETRLTFTAEGAGKTILDINALSKRILGTAIEVLIVRRGATVVVTFCNLSVLCAFAVRNRFF